MSRQSKRIQAVLFDFDDTLIDWSRCTQSWEEGSLASMNKVHDYLAAQGHALPDKKHFHRQYYEVIKRSWARANETLASVCFANVLIDTLVGFDLNVHQINLDAVMRVYDWGPTPGVVLYDDTIPVLAYLRQHGYRIGLITNSMVPMWMRDIELRHYRIHHYFDAKVTSGDVGFIKPHPAIYRQTLDSLNITPDRAVFVGDRPQYDIVGANNAGLISVWMNPPYLSLEFDGAQPADFTITKLGDLLPILKRLEENGVKNYDETGTQ